MTVRDISYVGEGLIPAPLLGDAKRYTPLAKADVTDIAVHHMTGWNPPPDAPVDWEIRFLQGIDEYHRTSRGLDGIGYHICPMASGRIYITARLDRYGAHVGYQNDHLIGVSLPGDYSANLPAARHLAATAEAVRYAYDYLGRDVPTMPHLRWGGTTCPGARWREWVPQLRAKAIATEEEDMDRAQFNKWWMENWGKYVADPPKVDGKDVAEPTGHLNRYLRGGYPRLQKNAAVAATKGGVLTKLVAQVNTLEALKNSVGWGTDRKTMGEWFTEWRAAIKMLQEAVAALEASGDGRSFQEIADGLEIRPKQ